MTAQYLAAVLTVHATLTPDEAEQAICAQADWDAWFPEVGQNSQQAKAICRRQCPIRLRCLEVALANGETHGIWGGLSWGERKQLLRDQGQAA